MKHIRTMRQVLLLLLTFSILLAGTPQPALAASFAAIVTSSNMKVYSDKALKNGIGSVKNGEIVTVDAYSGSVAAITYKGNSGYASTSDMQKVSSYGEKAVVTASGAKVYQSASTSSRSASLKKGTEVYVVATSGNWSRIVKGSQAAYTQTSNLSTGEAAPVVTPQPTKNASETTVNYQAFVASSNAKVYKKANTTSSSIAVSKGLELTVTAVSGSWARVERGGKTGYIQIDKLSTEAPSPAATPAPTAAPTPQNTADNVVFKSFDATVTADTLTVYKSSSTSSAQLGTLKKGTSVTVVAYNSTMAYIERNGKRGYCLRSGLAKTSSADPTLAPTATPSLRDAVSATVTADSIKVYASASTDAKVLGTLSKGTSVNVVDANATWAFIERNGNFGFCSVKALAKGSDGLQPGAKAKFSATVIYPSMPVYVARSTDAAHRSLSLGSTVEVYAYDDTWAYIGKDGAYGYALVKHMSNDSYTEINASSSKEDILTLQKRLEALGYFDGIPGGNYGTLTSEAIKRFQEAAGLSQTGQATEATLRVLVGGYAPSSPLLSASLSKGSTGGNVTRLQTRLLAKGYLSKSASVDGDYGTTTVAAVKLFQTQAGLTASGTADKATLSALYKNNAPSYSGSSPADAGATPSPTESGDKNVPNDSGDTPGGNSKIETVISAAKAQLGKPYVYGATGMSSFDCSGLTQYAFRQAGYSLSRTAYAQGYNDGTKITGLSNLVRGDIVCMNTISDSDLSDHVGIYLGGGQMIHASSGSHKVIISSLSSGYYNRVFSWGRRIIQ